MADSHRHASQGKWSLVDNSVSFSSPTGATVAELLVLRYRGSYRLVHNFGDPDDWAYSLDFARVNESKGQIPRSIQGKSEI